MVLKKQKTNSSNNESEATSKETSFSEEVISDRKPKDNILDNCNLVSKETMIDKLENRSNDPEFLLHEDNLDDSFTDPDYVPSNSDCDSSNEEEIEQNSRKVEEAPTSNDLFEDYTKNTILNKSSTLQTQESATSRKRKRNFRERICNIDRICCKSKTV